MEQGVGEPGVSRARTASTDSRGNDQAAGDDGLPVLLEELLPRLSAFVRLRIDRGLQARVSASDVVQSVYAELLANRPSFRFRGAAALKQWLHRAVLWKLREKERFHRARRRDVRTEEFAFDRVEFSPASRDVVTPSQIAIGKERLALFEDAFSRLSGRDQEVITLSRILGLSQEETAAAMGATIPSTRNLLSRALSRLARSMENATAS